MACCVKNHFLRELKDEGLMVIRHVARDYNTADLFIKNTTAAIFEKHIPNFVGLDKDHLNCEYGRVSDFGPQAPVYLAWSAETRSLNIRIGLY